MGVVSLVAKILKNPDIADFEELNFFNMCWFYWDELLQIYHGADPKTVLDRGSRSSLHRLGVFRLGGKGDKTSRHILTSKAVNILVHKLSHSGIRLTDEQVNRLLFGVDRSEDLTL